MADLLSSIHYGYVAKPPRIMIYGMEGIGKSTFASNFPNPIFIQTEDGLDNIDCASFPLCKKFDDALEQLDALIDQKHRFQTIVIDSLDWLERLIWKKTCEDAKVPDIEKVGGGYGKGYVVALTSWGKIIDRLTRLRDEKKCAFVLTAHAKTEDYSDPEISTIKRFSPRINKHAAALFADCLDLVLLGTREFGAAKGDVSGGARIVRSVPTPVQSAKKRYGIPDVLPMDANVVLNAIGAYQQSLMNKKQNASDAPKTPTPQTKETVRKNAN